MLNRRFLSIFLFFIPIILNGQNNYSDKLVSTSSGKMTLKTVFKTLSEQTGCIFSYDPITVNDKQLIILAKCNKLSLKTALQKILPPSIQFKFYAKYVVLQKVVVTNVPKIEPLLKFNSDQKQNAISTPKGEKNNVEIIKGVDSIPKNKAELTNLLLNDSLKSDTVQIQQSIVHEIRKSNLQPPIATTSDTIKSVASKPKENKLKGVFELELAGTNHLGTFSTRIGLNNIYSIISIGSDYAKSYHLGIGVGASSKLYKHLGMNFDLIRYALVGGSSFKVKIRAATIQFSPILNYSIGQRLKIFAGPSVYLINSRYVNGKVINLGNYVGFSANLGVRVDLSSQKKRNL